MLSKKEALDLLRREVVPALGCTEPVCVALCAAHAYNVIGGEVVSIKMDVNTGIFKNGMSVGIPGFDGVGLKYAAALGGIIGDPGRGLELMAEVTPEIASRARQMADEGRVAICVAQEEPRLYCRADVITTNGIGIAVIRDEHSRLVYLRSNNRVLTDESSRGEGDAADDLRARLSGMRIAEIRSLVDAMDNEDLKFMLDGAEMNTRIAEAGMSGGAGIGVTDALMECMGSDIWGDNLQSRIMLLTAACAESRMSGCPSAVMSSAGSGNHGITAIIPVVEVARRGNATDAELARALAFSHLVNVYIKQYTGRLSPICGCAMSAASAASAAMAWLLGGDDEQISGAIINMSGNLTGMVCDGGKIGCALKLATAASAALMSAKLAVSGVVIHPSDGIAARTAEEAIRHMGMISSRGMKEAEGVILDIMTGKE